MMVGLWVARVTATPPPPPPTPSAANEPPSQIDAGADVNTPSNTGVTPAVVCLLHRHGDMPDRLQCLLEAPDFNIDACTLRRRSLLELAQGHRLPYLAAIIAEKVCARVYF
jgi:hypothetical protein